jgi:SAM-dependent methyltransferase
MDPRLQIRIQRYGWDSAAAHYHQGWQVQLRPAHEQLLAMIGLRPGQRVIETACGSGLVTVRIAEQVGAGGHVLATDISEGMIEDLRTRMQVHAISNVSVRRMPAEELDLPDASFDVAICALGLMYTPDPRTAVAELARAVKPGGMVAATVWGERRNCGWADVFPIVDRRVASEVCPLFFGTGAQGALARIFEDVGLEQLHEVRHKELLSYQSDDEVSEAVLLGGPVALAVKRFSDDVWQDVRREFLASLSDFGQLDGSYRIPGEFVTVTGLRPST